MPRCLVLAALALAGCERPAPLHPPPRRVSQTLSTPAEGPRESATSRPAEATPRQVVAGALRSAPKPATALVARYRGEADLAERHGIISDLLDSPPIEVVAAVGELLAFEKRPELRIALLDSLDAVDGQEAAKVALIRAELLQNRGASDTRDAAIDALLNIQHRAAIPVWESLLDDEDDSLRDVARQAIAGLERL